MNKIIKLGLLGVCFLTITVYGLVYSASLAEPVSVDIQGLSFAQKKHCAVFRISGQGIERDLELDARTGLFQLHNNWAFDLRVLIPPQYQQQVHGIVVTIGTKQYLQLPSAKVFPLNWPSTPALWRVLSILILWFIFIVLWGRVSIRCKIIPGGWFIFLMLFLLPVYFSGFYKDDAKFFLTLPTAQTTQTVPFSTLAQANLLETVSTKHRLAPVLTTLEMAVPYYLQDAGLSKVVSIFIVLLGAVLLGWLVFWLTGQRRLAYAALVLWPGFLQLRSLGHDPVLGYFSLLPLFWLFFGASLVAWCKYLAQPQRYVLVVTFCFYLLALLTYEIALPLVLSFVLIEYLSNKRLRSVWWLVGLALVYAMCVSVLPVLYPLQGYLGTVPSWNIVAMAKAYFLQTLAVVPLTNVLLVEPGLLVQYWVLGLVVFVGTWLLTQYLVLPYVVEIRKSTFSPQLLAVGGALVFLPPALIAVSIKYQETLFLGYGYLPVFIQGLGLVMCLLSSFAWLYKKNPQIEALLTIIIALTFTGNILTVLHNPQPNNIQGLKKSIHQGLLQGLPAGARVYIWSGGDSLAQDIITLAKNYGYTVACQDIVHIQPGADSYVLSWNNQQAMLTKIVQSSVVGPTLFIKEATRGD